MSRKVPPKGYVSSKSNSLNEMPLEREVNSAAFNYGLGIYSALVIHVAGFGYVPMVRMTQFPLSSDVEFYNQSAIPTEDYVNKNLTKDFYVDGLHKTSVRFCFLGRLGDIANSKSFRDDGVGNFWIADKENFFKLKDGMPYGETHEYQDHSISGVKHSDDDLPDETPCVFLNFNSSSIDYKSRESALKLIADWADYFNIPQPINLWHSVNKDKSSDTDTAKVFGDVMEDSFKVLELL